MFRNPSTRFKANRRRHESDSWRYGNRRRDWDETAGVIRVNLMWTDTIDRPCSGSNSCWNKMTGYDARLPITRNARGRTTWGDKQDIEKRLLSQIRTRNTHRKGRSCNNARFVELQSRNDLWFDNGYRC